MIVDVALYRDGHRHDVGRTLEALGRARGECRSGDFVWVGLFEPGFTELNEVARVFGMHPLAVEDAVVAHQRPKLERYDDQMFFVLKTLWYVDATDQVETGEIAVFAGSDFVVTVRHGEGSSLQGIRSHLDHSDKALADGPSAVIYRICDLVVDTYQAVAGELVQDVDEVETSVFSDERTKDATRIYVLKRELAEVRRAVLPLREPLMRLTAGNAPVVHAQSAPYFRDVSDHLTRVAETVESLEQLLSSAFDVHLAQISVQQNDDMRKISAGAALVVVPTLIAGVYGMNFDEMPELHWRFGYPMALVLMAGTVSLLWWFFKRSKWL